MTAATILTVLFLQAPLSPDARLQRAIALRDAGKTDQAIFEFETAIRQKPDYDDAWIALTTLRLQSAPAPNTVAAYRGFVRRYPSSADAHNWLGVALLETNDLPAATAEFRTAVELRPDFARAWNNLGTTLAQSGDVEQGVNALQKAFELQPADLRVRVNLAMALRTRGDAGLAEEHFRAVLKQQPDNADVHFQLGQTLRQKGDIDGAVAELERALLLHPELRDAYYALGQALKQAAGRMRRTPRPQPAPAAEAHYKQAVEAVAKGRLPQAATLLRAAIDADRSFADAFNLLGWVLGQQRDLEGADQHLNIAIKLNPRSAQASYNLCVVQWYRGNRAAALASLADGVALDPADSAAAAFCGMALREGRKFDEAKRYLQRAIALNPALPDAYIDLAVVFLRTGDAQRASGQLEAALNLPGAGRLPDLDLVVTELRAVLKTAPSAEVHNLLGRVLGRQGAPADQVAAEFRHAIRLQPSLASAHNNLGLVLAQQGHTADAIKAFREAVRLSPHADARSNLGAALTESDPGEAVRHLEEAVRLQPRLRNAHFNLAHAYGRHPAHGRDKEIEQLQKVIELDESFTEARYALGRALLQRGSVDDAIKHLQRAVELKPDHGAAHYQLGLALARAGKKETAGHHLAYGRELVAAEQKAETVAALMREARASLDRKDYQLAADALRKAIQVRPDNFDARLALGQVLSEQQLLDEAVIELRKARELAPASFDAARLLGLALRAKGDAPGAVNAFQEAVRLRPSDAGSWHDLGLLLFDSGDAREAESALRKAHDLEPARIGVASDLMRIRQALAPPSSRVAAQPMSSNNQSGATAQDDRAKMASIENFIRERRYVDADPLLKTYVQEYPQSSWGWYAAGYVAFAQKRIGEAVNALARSLQLNVDNVEAHKMLGLVLMTIGRFDAAELEFRHAARLQPGAREVYFNLGQIYSAQDNFPAAERELDQALKIDPNYMEAWNAKGFVMESLGRDADALACYQKASGLNESLKLGFSAPYINLSAYYNRTGDTEKALAFANEALKLDPRSDLAYFQVGRAYDRRQQWPAAAEALEKAITINPNSSSFYYVLGAVYRRMGKAAESRRALEQFQKLEREGAELEKKKRESRADVATADSGGSSAPRR